MPKKKIKLIEKIKQIKRDLWPVGCLEDGENDPISARLEGFCLALNRYEEKVLKLIRRGKK